MKTEFRNRAFLPVVMPLGILLTVVVLVLSFAAILLYNTKEAALVIAIVAAGGILLAISLAASKDHLDGRQKAAVFSAGALPVVLGAVFSVLSVNGLVDASALNINREPHLQVPEGALIGAQNDQSFCLFDEAGDCVDSSEWEMAAQPDAPPFVFEFDNIDPGVPHNVQIFALAGSEEEPEAGDGIFVGVEDSPLVTGVDSIVYQVDQAIEPGTYYYNCVVHPVMEGVLTITEATEGGGEEA
jgi:hypothetical protein